MDNIWRGHRVWLRAIEPGDWEEFFAWSADTAGQRASWQIFFPTSAEARRRKVADDALHVPADDAFRWAITEPDGGLVGSINSHTCDRRHGTFQYGLGVRPDFQGRGYASEAIRLVLRYFFRELRYQKVSASIYDFNEPSLRLHRRLGFQQEGRLRRAVFTEGRFHDTIIFGLTAEEFAEQHLGLLPPA